METIENLIADSPNFADPEVSTKGAVLELLRERGCQFTDWAGWLHLNEHELELGANFQEVVRERVKVLSREEQVELALGGKYE